MFIIWNPRVKFTTFKQKRYLKKNYKHLLDLINSHGNKVTHTR
jgi:hypothetical protein